MRLRGIITLIVALALAGVMGTAVGVQPTPLMEDFEDGNVAGWVASLPGPSGNGTFEAVTSPTSPSGGDYVGRQTFGWSCGGWGYSLASVAPDYMSWHFRADGDTSHPSGLAFVPAQSNLGELLMLSYHQGWLRYGEAHPIMPASQGTWYLIELRNIDWAADTLDIWVDGVERLGGVPFAYNLDYVDLLYNYACPWASGPSYVDNITVGFYYGFEGFLSPVDNDVVNVAQAGQTIPVKFRVMDANGAPVSDLTTPPVIVSSSGTACEGGDATDVIETYAASSGLQNLGDGYYQFNWKTPKLYKGQCRTMMVSLGDLNTDHTAEFQFK